MIVLVIYLMATYVQVDGQAVCLPKPEESQLNNLRNQLRGFEKTLSDLEWGLKV